MSTQTRILIVEDEPSIGDIMVSHLRKEGYDPVLETDGERAMQLWAADRDFALVILDIVLPGLDGLAICRAIRESSEIPILMLTGKTDATSVVVGLEVGADDYVKKPFDLIELKARVRALLRRTRMVEDGRVLSWGSLVVDSGAGRVTKEGSEVPVSATEFRLLVELLKSPGKVHSRQALLRQVWDHDYLGDSRLVDMAIKRLRDKIEDDPANPTLISTVRGLGYRLEPAPEAAAGG